MKQILLIAFFLISLSGFSQHTTQSEYVLSDSTVTTSDAFKSIFLFESVDTSRTKKGNFCVGLAPNVLAAYQDKEFATQSGLQFSINSGIGKKIKLLAIYKAGYSNVNPRAYQAILQSKAFFYLPQKGRNQFIYNDIRGRISYRPNQFFEFQGGIDHHFLGEGDRSLLSGNQGVANPFVSLKVKFWKFEYHNIQQIWREGVAGHYIPKANSSHYLSFSTSKKFSIGIFESVTHLIKDTIYNRGFEPEYLNPLIFYRPQEYSIGSSDNVLLGINGHISWKKSMIYGQFALDEFLLSEIRARSRWWANKYGFQIGYKSWIKLRQQAVFIRSEFNLVRPFTYAHLNNSLNIGNQGLPVAHPLGSNFVESYNEFAFRRGQWNVQFWTQLYLKGIDPDSSSYGGDIYKSYINRPNNKEYGFYIGSGIKTYAVQLGLQVARKFRKVDFEVFAEPRIYLQHSLGKTSTDPYLTIGIHSAFGADKRNY